MMGGRICFRCGDETSGAGPREIELTCLYPLAPALPQRLFLFRNLTILALNVPSFHNPSGASNKYKMAGIFEQPRNAGTLCMLAPHTRSLC